MEVVMGDLSAFGTVLAQLFLAATAMVFIFMIVVSLLAVHLVRRVFRSSAVKKANLTVKAQSTMPGPRRDLAQLRLRLHRAVASAKTASSLLQANGPVWFAGWNGLPHLLTLNYA
jgi:hypothetical protein